MTPKERLKAYRDLARYTRNLENEILSLVDRATAARQQKEFARVKISIPQDPMGDIITSALDKAALLKRKAIELADERRAIENMIAPLTVTEQHLIYLRYIAEPPLSWEMIAREMSHGIRHTQRIHGEILKKIS
jgi:DNA-directed RNA polymerase specialized sigma subunit